MRGLGEIFRTCRHMQYLAAMSAAMGAICSYMIGSWSSPCVPKLTSADSPLGVPLSSEEVSWVVSSPLLGYTVGCLISSIPLKLIGPKWSLLITSLPISGCWFGIAFSKSSGALITFRFLSGVCDGIIITVLPLYIGEVADKDIRGKLISFAPIFAGFGNFIVLALGPFVTYHTLTLICAAVPIIFGTIFVFLPESPYFLLKTGRNAESKCSLRALLGSNVDGPIIEERIKEIEATVGVDRETSHKCNVLYIFSKKHFRFALFVSLHLKLMSVFGGMSVIKSYLQTIIGASGSSISPEISSLSFAIAQQPSAILSAYLVDRVGRKILLIVSTLGCTLTLGIEGLYFYMEDVTKTNMNAFSWMPTVCLAIYTIVQPIGVGSLPSIIMGEIFADEIKGVAACISTTISGCFVFLLARFFLPIAEAWGMHVMFWIFSVLCFYGAIFAAFVQPETKGKSFLEIQKKLSKSRCC